MRTFDELLADLEYRATWEKDEVESAKATLRHMYQQKTEENERLNNLFRSTISALARIDVALGIEDDACNELEITLQAIEELKANAKRGQQLAVAVMNDNGEMLVMECTNDDKWNCKYCRKVKSCEANKAGTTARPPAKDWTCGAEKRCDPCRETGAIHCADPSNCGGPWDARKEKPRMVFESVNADEYNGEA